MEADKKESRAEAAPCQRCGELEGETAQAGKRVGGLEASISWLHAEFATLHTEFVTLCDEAEDASKRSGRTPVSSSA